MQELTPPRLSKLLLRSLGVLEWFLWSFCTVLSILAEFAFSLLATAVDQIMSTGKKRKPSLKRSHFR